ncbi:MAG TPA: hypothetical protein VK504_29230, partial [Vicinamibacterales bacterium]|nr:hypothetical protein [Vicinamibacterales bacterium]
MPGRIRAVWPGTPIAPDPYKGIKIDTPVPKPTRRLVELALGSQSDADNNAPIPRLYGLHEIKSKPSQVRYGFQSFDTLYVVRVLALGQREATVFGAESSGQLDGVAAVYDERGRAASSFANFSYVFHNGALSQGVDTSLAGVDGSWNETLVITDKTGKLRGISYVVEIYQNVSKYWKTLPSWYYQVRGSRIANLLNSSTVEYTENLFNIWRDWAIDPEGMYLSPSQLSMTRFTAAATVGNQTLGAGKRYSAHLEIGGGDVKDWLKMFRLLGDAYWFEDEAGLWSVLVDRPTAPVATYTDLHYSGSKQTEMGPQSDADELKNAVSIEYTNTATLPWTKLKVELRDATVASNTEDEDPLEYQLPALHDRAIAQTKLPYILYSNIDDYRLPLNWRANTGDRVMGDVVTQTIAERGLTGEWRLITRERLPNNTSDVELLLMSARKYADTNTAAAAQVTSTLADPFATPPDVVVGTIGFTVELPQLQGGSRSPRGILTWTNPSNDPFHDHFELSISVNGGATRSLAGNIISPCQIGDLLEIGNYTFTLVNVSTLDLKSAGTSKTFAYAGKTTPPSDVPYVWIERRGEEVKVCWLPPPDPDIGQYIVERGLTTDTWSTAGIVAVVGGSTNYILDKPATSVGLPGGAWRYLVKACDTSKNISVNAKTADIVVFAQGSPPAEVSGFGPHFFVEFGNEPDVLRFGDAIYEGVYTNATRRAMLCRALSPATAQSEITSGSLASIQQWETLVDAPRRGGQPLWA